MAGRPVCLLIFLMPSPRIVLRTLASYINLESIILFEAAKKSTVRVEFCAVCHVWNFTTNQAILIKSIFHELNSLKIVFFYVNIMLYYITKYLLHFLFTISLKCSLYWQLGMER